MTFIKQKIDYFQLLDNFQSNTFIILIIIIYFFTLLFEVVVLQVLNSCHLIHLFPTGIICIRFMRFPKYVFFFLKIFRKKSKYIFIGSINSLCFIRPSQKTKNRILSTILYYSIYIQKSVKYFYQDTT